jgi:CRISP-associated protein Cas1
MGIFDAEQQGAESDGDLVPARMLNELVYCPRLFYLEHVAGEWDDSADTLQGKRVHKRVDAATSALPPGDELPDAPSRARSVTVSSPAEGIIARTDLIEAEGGAVVPVDYKRGAAPDPARVPGGAWPADRVQVAAQALALRDSGYACDHAEIYYAASKQRVRVDLTGDAVAEVRAAVVEARRVSRLTVAPPPLVASPKCPRCSLVGICLPDEITSLLAEAAPPPPEEPADPHDAPLLRLIPARDDKNPLYVQAHGAQIGRSGDCLEIRLKDGTTSTARLREVSQVNVFGQVALTPSALHELCSRGIDVALFSFGGWFYGTAGGFPEQNVLLRIAQFAAAADPAVRLGLARALVTGKILNQRTLLRRNAEDGAKSLLADLKVLAARAEDAASVDELLGFEGSAARAYFAGFAKLLSPRSGDRTTFDFEGRNRRPPRDPVNALLSLGYALLSKDARIALLSVGFDPTAGFLHRPRHGRPSLALDLMEEMRPLIVDSTVLSAVNTEVLRDEHFVRAAGGCALTDTGRKAFLGAYERRMDQEVTHPLFGYTVSYRRILHVQARLLSRVVLGELPRYPSFRTR